MSTGNTHNPVAWVRFFPNGGPQSVYLDRPPADSEPLYRSPALTDEEREAVELAAGSFADQFLDYGDSCDREIAATLRKLLERLK